MIIDFHTHAFPDALAAGAIEKLGHNFGLFSHSDGTLEDLKRLMREDKVDLGIMLPIATTPRSQKKANDFAYTCRGDGVLALGSVHPFAPDALDELDRLYALGFKGLKFHPDYQGFYVNDERVKPVYRKISELGFVTVFHAGPDYGFRPPYKGMPKELRQALSWLDTNVIAAHWGGIDIAPEVIANLSGIEQLHLDTAFSYATNARQFAHELIEVFGIDHIVFGSDSPWHRPMWEQTLISHLDLSEKDLGEILCNNARRLLGLTDDEEFKGLLHK